MRDTDADLIEIVLVVDLIVSAWIVLLFVIFTQPPDDSMMPLCVGIITQQLSTELRRAGRSKTVPGEVQAK